MGIPPRTIDRRAQARRLTPLHRGIYLVGPIVPPFAPFMAAVLAGGDDAILSHGSAAVVHHLIPYPARVAMVDVTLIGRHVRRRPGVLIHRVQSMPSDERTTRHGIPLTTAARTILDLAAQLTTAELEQTVAQAHRRRLSTPKALEALLVRYRGRPGTPALRRILDGTPAFTRSKAERRLLELIRKADLPRPQVNARILGFEVDLLWPHHRLVVEVDGYPFHSSRPDRRRDQARDRELATHGYTVIRFDPDEVAARPEATIAALARATR